MLDPMTFGREHDEREHLVLHGKSSKVGAVVECELAHGLGLVSLGEEDHVSRGDLVPGSSVPKAVDEVRLAERLHCRQVSIILETDEVIQAALFVGRALYRVVP